MFILFIILFEFNNDNVLLFVWGLIIVVSDWFFIFFMELLLLDVIKYNGLLDNNFFVWFLDVFLYKFFNLFDIVFL